MKLTQVIRRHVRSVQARRTAARYLRDGALILDTETTDLAGYCVELSIIDAATGQTLLDTLVAPHAPISSEAAAVHRIDDAMLVGAPSWAQIAKSVHQLLDGRVVLAYNSAFDEAVLDREWQRLDVEAPAVQWRCLSLLRRRYERTRQYPRLGGGHRALGDCHSARDLLRAIAAGADTRTSLVRPHGYRPVTEPCDRPRAAA